MLLSNTEQLREAVIVFCRFCCLKKQVAARVITDLAPKHGAVYLRVALGSLGLQQPQQFHREHVQESDMPSTKCSRWSVAFSSNISTSVEPCIHYRPQIWGCLY